MKEPIQLQEKKWKIINIAVTIIRRFNKCAAFVAIIVFNVDIRWCNIKLAKLSYYKIKDAMANASFRSIDSGPFPAFSQLLFSVWSKGMQRPSVFVSIFTMRLFPRRPIQIPALKWKKVHQK